MKSLIIMSIVLMLIPFQTEAQLMPNIQAQTHSTGDLHLTINNWGLFGSMRGDDDFAYCIIYESGIHAGECRPSAEYPGESGVEYLFHGAFWIGGVVAGDTLVSVGDDGWFWNVNELMPAYDTLNPRNSIQYFSTDSGDVEALGNETFWAYFSDTVKNPDIVPASHSPLGIEIFQKSHQWSDSAFGNFVIFEITLTNITADSIEDTYFGIYVDGEVGHVDIPEHAQDDITGFIGQIIDSSITPPETTTINTAWIADNDGDPHTSGGHLAFDEYSCTGALAVIPLDYPPDMEISYNWWISNINEDYDWGPYKVIHDFGWDGTPEIERMKYHVLSNGEIDYDQTEIVHYSSYPDFVAPNPEVLNIGETGGNTRFLLSFGGFDLPPGNSKEFAFAVFVTPGFQMPGGDYDYDAIGREAVKIKEFYAVVTGIEENSPSAKPKAFAISAHPNPFNSAVRIMIETPSLSPPHAGEIQQAEGVTVEIFDLSGRRVETLRPSATSLEKGGQEIPLFKGDLGGSLTPLTKGGQGGSFTWQPAPSLPSGVYLVRARVDSRSLSGATASASTKRIVFLK